MTIENNIFGWILDNKVAPDAYLKQGDLIRFNGATNPLTKLGLVVTADCDLKNKKHGKLVTLVSVVTVQVIIENYLLVDDCEKNKESISQYAYKVFSLDNLDDLDVKKSMLIDKLDKLDKQQYSCEPMAIFAAKVAVGQVGSISVSEYIKLMIAIERRAKNVNDLHKQILSKGDLLVLPDTSKLGIDGNIAWVRHIWQEPLSNIALRTSEVDSCIGEKIGRLDSPFRYRLTQLMAQVFSDIGLPDISNPLENEIEAIYDRS